MFEREGYVSIWIGRGVPDATSGKDILKDLCGVDYYDVDFQDVVGEEDWREVPIESLLRMLPYSASYLSEAFSAAERPGIQHARWAVSQLDYDYRIEEVTKPIAADPVFLGSFQYHQ